MALPEQRYERALIPFLNAPEAGSTDICCASESYKGIMRCLASSAPVCQTMRPQLFPLAEKLLDVSLEAVANEVSALPTAFPTICMT